MDGRVWWCPHKCTACDAQVCRPQVMGVDAARPAFVAGNSLGGLLAVYLTAMHPELVRGLVLLNATPFWSIRPPLSAPKQGVWGLLPPGFGSLPVPQVRRMFQEAALARLEGPARDLLERVAPRIP